jgi:hypothetical protein
MTAVGPPLSQLPSNVDAVQPLCEPTSTINSPPRIVTTPSSVLKSHEADANANSERVPCFLLHLYMLIFSLPLIGFSWFMLFLPAPLGLVSLVTSTFGMYHLSSLRDMSVGCCCTPLGAYSWIFGMNVVLLVFAVPTLGGCIWMCIFWIGGWIPFILTATICAAAIIITAILALLQLSRLQRFCRGNMRPLALLRVRLPPNTTVTQSYPAALPVPYG